MNLFIIAPQNLAHIRPALATMRPHPKACAMGLSLTVMRAIAMALSIALAYVIDIGMTNSQRIGIALAWDIGHGTWTRN